MISNSILDVSSIRRCEAFTMESRGISSLELMERAGTACSDKVASLVSGTCDCDVFVFCGPGNNGGDGLVIARQLIFKHNFGGNVTVVLCSDENARISEQTKSNTDRWTKLAAHHTNAQLIDIKDFSFDCIKNGDLIIDSLFGIGLNKALSGIYSGIVEKLNATGAGIIAIDIPSGLFADMHTPRGNKVIRAFLTLTIQFTKLGLLLPENSTHFGSVEIIDAGIDESPEIAGSANRKLVTAEFFGRDWDRYIPFAHKGTFGHGFLIAGCSSMPGAAILSAKAAMRGGIGKLTVHSTKHVLNALTCHLPEAIHDADEGEEFVSRIRWNRLPENINAVAIGPGLGRSPESYSLLKDVLDTVTFPTIIDADALNMLAENKTRLAFLPPESILTPHFSEFERLAGKVENDFDRVIRARDFATKYSVVLILKGHNTVISMPDGSQFFNTTGNPGMATAGSGDVLTGLLLALLTQGYRPQYSALLGVFLHGAAADAYAQENHYKTLIANDITEYLNHAFKALS